MPLPLQRPLSQPIAGMQASPTVGASPQMLPGLQTVPATQGAFAQLSPRCGRSRHVPYTMPLKSSPSQYASPAHCASMRQRIVPIAKAGTQTPVSLAKS